MHREGSVGSGHQNPRHVAGVDRRRGPNGPDAVMAKGGKEVLGHGTIVAEVSWVLSDMVPALHGPLADLVEYLLPIYGLKVLLLVSIGDGGKSDWGAGCCTEVRVTNGTAATITWATDVTVQGTIPQLWNAKASAASGTVRFTGVDWIHALAAGAS